MISICRICSIDRTKSRTTIYIAIDRNAISIRTCLTESYVNVLRHSGVLTISTAMYIGRGSFRTYLTAIDLHSDGTREYAQSITTSIKAAFHKASRHINISITACFLSCSTKHSSIYAKCIVINCADVPARYINIGRSWRIAVCATAINAAFNICIIGYYYVCARFYTPSSCNIRISTTSAKHISAQRIIYFIIAIVAINSGISSNIHKTVSRCYTLGFIFRSNTI